MYIKILRNFLVIKVFLVVMLKVNKQTYNTNLSASATFIFNQRLLLQFGCMSPYNFSLKTITTTVLYINKLNWKEKLFF